MEVRVLGPLEVVDDHGSLARLGGRKQRIVLAALALRPNQTVPTDTLVDMVWTTDLPPRPDSTLQVYISTLRSMIGQTLDGSARIARQAPGYRLDIEPGVLDSQRFDALVDEGRAARDRSELATALDRLEAANSLWRGSLAADLADEPFVQSAAVGANERRREALALTFDTLLAAGRHAETVGPLESLCAEDPGHERLWELLMLALYRSGRALDATRTFQRARQALLDNAGLDPSPALVELEHRILEHDPALAAPLPPPESITGPGTIDGLFGRRALRVRVVEALAAPRATVTLTGPAGVGKSRLAAAASTEFVAQRRPAARTATVALDGLPAGDPDDVAALAALAAELNVPWREEPESRVREALAETATLVLLDGCDDHLDAARRLARLAVDVPGTTVLATGRAALGLEAETVVAVGPLLPDGQSTDPAIALFVDRASHACPGWEPRIGDEATIAGICDLVDRLPLGIELAASQLRTVSLDELAERLMTRVAALADPVRAGPQRHRSLGAAFAASIESLDEPDRTLLHELIVFSGGWNLDALRTIFGDEAIDRLDDLVASGVVWVDTAAPRRRYRLPVAVRDLLADDGPPATETVRRHGAHYAAEAQRWGAQRFGREARIALEALRVDQHNVASALDAASAVDGDLAAAIAVAIGHQFLTPSRLRWMTPRVDALVERGVGAADDRNRLRVMSGVIAYLRGDMSASRALLTDAVDELSSEDEWWARGQSILAMIDADEGRPGAIERAHKAVDAAQTTGRPHVLTRELDAATVVAVITGNLDQAEKWTLDKLDIEQSRQDDHGRCFSLERLAWISYQRGLDGEAERYAREALTLAREVGVELIEVYAASMVGHALLERAPADALRLLAGATARLLEEDVPLDAADVLLAVAAAAGLTGDGSEAARYVGAADQRYAGAGVERPLHVKRLTVLLDSTEARLGPEAWGRGERAGRLLTDDDLTARLRAINATTPAAGEAAGV